MKRKLLKEKIKNKSLDEILDLIIIGLIEIQKDKKNKKINKRQFLQKNSKN